MRFRLWLEGAEDDQKIVKTAIKVWNKIVKEIDKIPMEAKETEAVRQGKTVPLKGIAFDLGVLFPYFRGLTVFLCGGISSAAAYSKPLNTIFLKLLDRDSQFNDDGHWEKQTARLRIKAWSKERGRSFIHEFVHYLDSRRDGMVWHNPPNPLDDEHRYFNSPLEFNAFYQEFISELERTLKRDHFLRPFDEFMTIATRRMSEFPQRADLSSQYGQRATDIPAEKWMDKLDTNYRQKFIRRLYQYYTMRRSRYKGLSESSDLDSAWKDYRSWRSSRGEDWGPNTSDNLERLERIGQMGIERNAQGSRDYSTRMKWLPNWFESPDGKRREYQTPEGAYVIVHSGDGGMMLGEFGLTAPDGESLGWHASPEDAAEAASEDWAENFE
jgi:hypothetical protein